MVRSGRNSNLFEILCMSSLPASIKRVESKTTEKRWRHRFPHYKSMGAFCCHGNQSFDPICPKTLCSLSPTQVMLHIKFHQDWPTDFRDIQVWKCGLWWTDNWPLVYYILAHRIRKSKVFAWDRNFYLTHVISPLKECFHVNSVCTGCLGRHITLSLGWRHSDVTVTSF